MKILSSIALLLLLFLNTHTSSAQLLDGENGNYDRADSLRGSLRPERTNYDVLKYNLNVKVVPEKKYIEGFNEITFEVKDRLPKMQLDLFANMNVDSIVFQGQILPYKREFNAVFIKFSDPLQAGQKQKLRFYYSGNPKVAKRPPWDGGFIFRKDKNGKPWVSVAVQGTGASLWYPNKDHLSDEPEEAEIHVAAPNGLMNVSNGRLVGSEKMDKGYTRWDWKVENPINNYNIILNIGDYVHFSDKFEDLDLNYYVLSYNLEKAKKQFQQVKPMMACFTEKFGPYPFPEDSYKLVQTPYLGMEHQSAVAYGNQFSNGYYGRDLSGTGIGLRWDYIIIHESGHEWFGNSISVGDIADMWIHEGFTTYSEAVYVECQYGKKDALKYLKGLSQNAQNDKPIIGDFGVNNEGSGDMYFKGANMLNTLRSIIDNDEKWWDLLKNFSLDFRHKITNTQEVIDYFNTRTETDVEPLFRQYLSYSALPKLHLKRVEDKILARWETDVKKFEVPVDLIVSKGEKIRVHPTNEWKALSKLSNKPGLKLSDVKLDRLHFYVQIEKD
jgi:aminopeptidase N